MEHSILGRLPAEIRNAVFEFALYEPNGIELFREPGLLSTCRNVRADAELMFYAINDFRVCVQERQIDHVLCHWLKQKAGPRLRLIRSLTIHFRMPSVGLLDSAEFSEIEEELMKTNFMALMHLMDNLRSAQFGRCTEAVVSFTVNGACDHATFKEIDKMSLDDQDRYQAAKFLIMGLVHGERETLAAAEATNSREILTELDLAIRQNRTAASTIRQGV